MRTLPAFLCAALLLFAAPATAAQTATQFYMEYNAAWNKATSIDALLPYLGKDSRAEIEATPKDKRAEMFDMMKEMGRKSKVKVVKETKTADGYTLDVTATGPDTKPMRGIVTIIMEGAAMKLQKESWTS
jgi:hypothetical protein